MTRLDCITFDCARPAPLARFWCEVLDYEVAPYDEEELARLAAMGIDDVEEDPSVLILPKESGPRMFFTKVPEPKVAKNRVHLDVRLTQADVDHLVDLGARVVTGPTEENDWYVLADPEGNEFCAILP
jgi:hypothetical protein